MNRDSSVAGLASLVQSRGRNGDSVLVHMTPGEVQGLQALALSAGGSLTVNPETGLVEANFLKKLLPTLLGFGLNFLIPGLGALGSGLLVGAGETIRTGGDLGKGLMAGLGAFGGAGLGAGLSAAAQGGSAALTGVTPTGLVPGTEAFRQAAAAAAPTTAATSFAPTAAASQMANAGSFLSSTASPAATVARSAAEAAKGGIGSSLTQGVRALGSQAGRTAFMEAIPGGMTGIAAGGMGIANALTPEFQPQMTPEEEQMYYESYGYDPSQGRFLGGQFRRGYPGYAMGGSVMPRTNYGYPQAGITKSNYAPNLEYSKPREILDGYDAKINPFTGEEAFADGGAVGVAPGATGGDQVIDVTGNVPSTPPVPQQTLEQYYQSLLAPPPPQNYDQSFANYMQGLNKFVTSPVAPPKPPVAQPTTPAQPVTPTTPNQPFDPSKFDFSNFNFGDFMNGSYGGDIEQYLAGMGGDNRMTWNPATGTFGQPSAAQTATSTPATTNEDVVYAGGTPGFDFSNFQMGDMSPYGTEFQGFQPQSTDFGSTYQPPAMNTPIFNAQPYAPQQMDFGSMGDYGLGALGSTYSAPTFQAPTMDFSNYVPSVPAPSYQAPMTTGMESTGMTVPQFQYGNSDVMYGQNMLGDNDANIFGFAGGGSVQRAAAGKLITGEGDGMSDDIRANISGNQEARLADGEFVIPADVVSHLGNGSTDAGADQLHAMMDRIRKARTGRSRQAPEIDPDEFMPA